MGKSAGEIEGGIRAALRYCSLEATGLWCLMRYVIDDSDRAGHLRQNGRPLSGVQLAREAGCTPDAVARLQQELADAGLIVQADRTWHAPHLARLSDVRSQGAARVQRLRDRRAAGKADSTGGVRRRAKRAKTPAASPGEPSGPPALRNAACNADVTPPSPVPSPGSPPTTPSPIPTPSPSSDPSDRPAGGAEGGGSGSAAPRPARRRATGPAADVIEHFTAAWQAKYAKPYPFKGGKDGQAVKDVLAACGGAVDDTIAAMDRFLADDDQFLFGHRLTLLAGQITRFMTDRPANPAGKAKLNGHHPKPNPADRGQYPEPPRDLPEFGKTG